jgi:DNA-binding NarL/FixJ family response regulator
LAALLQREADLQVRTAAGAGATAVSLFGPDQPDLVILDAASERARGLELLKEFKEFRPQIPVLIVSMHDDTLYAERSLRAGAKGFITTEEAATHMLSAVRTVLGGEVYVSERMAERLIERKAGAVGGSPLEMLTAREWEVYRRIGVRMSTQQIAEELHLAIRKVEAYCAAIREKLELAEDVELFQQASQWAQKQYEQRTQR